MGFIQFRLLLGSLGMVFLFACNAAGDSSNQKGSSNNKQPSAQKSLQLILGEYASDCRSLEVSENDVASERAELRVLNDRVEVIYQAFRKAQCEDLIEDLLLKCSARIDSMSVVRAKIRSEVPESDDIVYVESDGLKLDYVGHGVDQAGIDIQNAGDFCKELLPIEGEVLVARLNYLLRSHEIDDNIYRANDNFKYWKQ